MVWMSKFTSAFKSKGAIETAKEKETIAEQPNDLN